MMRLLPLLYVLALAGCSYLPDIPLLGDDAEPPAPTLADLQPLTLELQDEDVPERSLRELEQAYREVLQVSDDPALQLKVRRRLADLEMMATEIESLEEPGSAGSYDAVIASYEALLRDYPEVAGSDQLMYQMARAHDLDGRGDEAVALMTQLSEQYPNSEHVAEAEFRKGEAYFSAGNYARAAQAYERVVSSETGNEYYANGMYMLGWSRFKLNRLDQSIEAFTATLDALMQGGRRLDSLARGDREIVDDCLRVLAVVFDERGGSDAIANTYAQLGARDYQPLIYGALGELYLQQERFEDSARTYAGFIQANPLSQMAPTFQREIIAVYEAAGFPQQVIAAKQDYVADYRVAGEYWRWASGRLQAAISPFLAQYIDELARHHHALAQSESGSESRRQYLLAAEYYQQYVDSFPRNERRPQMMFLMAESLAQAKEYRLAIDAYEGMAYRYPEREQAAEAAYAAILAHVSLASAQPDDRIAMIDSQLSFTRVFAEDGRAPLVLGSAASALLDASLYNRASQAAGKLVAWEPAPSADLVTAAWLVIGHAEFAMERHTEAEQAYLNALAMLPPEDPRRGATTESLAASVYRQGEAAASSGRYLLAADSFARVMEVAPTSSIRLNAQYDAASHYLLAGDRARGTELLQDFRARYPDHALTAGIGARLVESYEADGQWAAAARELDGINQSSDDPAVQREALYLAADYYQRAGETSLAIDRYRDYAHTWKQPLAPRMEAMLTLADIYAGQGESVKRNYWLNAIADAHDQAAEQADDRSRYLAASAVSEIADGHYERYLAIALNEPLPESLRRKRKALDQTVAAYDRVNGYGLQEFGTRATFRLGQVYRRLANELMSSPRPAGLDELALEQYEVLLEEQAWPFEEKAIAIFETNARRAWDGLFDTWIEQSFAALSELMPARWGKQEQRLIVVEEIR